MHDVFVIGEYVDRSMLWYGTSHHTPTIQYQYHRYHTILHPRPTAAPMFRRDGPCVCAACPMERRVIAFIFIFIFIGITALTERVAVEGARMDDVVVVDLCRRLCSCRCC